MKNLIFIVGKLTFKSCNKNNLLNYPYICYYINWLIKLDKLIITIYYNSVIIIITIIIIVRHSPPWPYSQKHVAGSLD